ncbi:unnamed protein product [Cuscuta epithymum]|uniref:E2 ubiquitin-conjugating enzyme n=1 Tax=Cuscuta epithymum TaxID=186058 RepID=A0AAV0DQA4_9ASTE|nr:unnamed protein product [Cuscuta epithymum]
MAQAARLILRMQKELKLLLSDPPHGASFPSLSSSSSAPSLSSIDAEIEGPEGTVYANGLFKLKIQVPERYPFHPPVVTFVTPIYHPNIDNGGRICLDILNLPPKGAWQPSLNISTVLTSIGLLLSEPNPDDGLMHDASKEYKYNMQAFYQKARSMTEKFAMHRASQVAASVPRQEFHTQTNPHTEILQVDNKGPSQNRSSGVSRMLSLDCLGSEHHEDSNTNEVSEIPANYLLDNQNEAGGSKPKRNTAEGVNEIHSNNQIEAEFGRGRSFYRSLKRKQSLAHHDLKLKNRTQCHTISDFPQPGTTIHHNGDTVCRNLNQLTTMKHKKLGLSGRKISLGSSCSTHPSLQNNKENLLSSNTFADPKGNLHVKPSAVCVMSEAGESDGFAKKSCTGIVLNMPDGNQQRRPLKSMDHLQESVDIQQLDQMQCQQDKVGKNVLKEIETSTYDHAVIVLDSEDSEDDSSLPARSKLSLALKSLPVKQKAKT